MTDTNLTSEKSALPSFTGNPVIDTAIRQLVVVICGAISGVLVAYLMSKGVTDQTLLANIPAELVTLVISVITLVFAIWSVVNKKNTVTAVVDHVIAAAKTGAVPASVKALATPAQHVTIASAGK